MATNSPLIPSKESQESLLEFSRRVLTEHQKFSDYYSKMEAVDIAYARYQENVDPVTGVVRGQGIDAATTPVGVVNMPSTTPPVVVSQVDSMVSYLAEVFLSGSPLFPVVSTPKDKAYAEQLETLLDDHATLGGYARQLLMFLRDGVKYNLSAVEVEWTAIDQYTILDELLEPGAVKMQKDPKSFNKVKRLDPYNTVWDHNVSPGDIALEGDYAGHISIISRTKLKRMLNRWANDGRAINIKEAMDTSPYTTPEGLGYYRIHPQVSNYVAARKPISGMNWMAYLGGADQKNNYQYAGNFEMFTLYARIIPADHKLKVPSPNTPQIWKLVFVNNSVLVQAERIISAYDMLPILFGQPLEDGLGYQTQSIAEGNIPFQQAATTLFNIRFNAARRSVSDRALYDPSLISPADVNAPVAAAKIPVRTNSLDASRRIQDAYHPIPFDGRGTELAMQDGMQIVGFGKELSGLNNPLQGQFQKGNKSVKEWTDTMGNADARLRLPALTLEYQVFMPLKEMLKLNIFQYGQDSIVVSQKSGETISVDLAALRNKVLAFRLADGYTPKSKLAGTDGIQQLMQILTQSQMLQERYGPSLPAMFAHLAQLMGVRGLEEYTPSPEQQQQNMTQAQAMQAIPNMVQQGVQDVTNGVIPPQGAIPGGRGNRA